MASSPQHQDEVVAMLEKSKIWAQYRDQKHDLFLDNKPVTGYLTAGSPGVSGYLTQGGRMMPPTPSLPVQPPNMNQAPQDMP